MRYGIITCNRPHFLRRLLKRIIEIDSNLNILIVDNSSKEKEIGENLEIIKGYTEKGLNIQYLRKEVIFEILQEFLADLNLSEAILKAFERRVREYNVSLARNFLMCYWKESRFWMLDDDIFPETLPSIENHTKGIFGLKLKGFLDMFSLSKLQYLGLHKGYIPRETADWYVRALYDIYGGSILPDSFYAEISVETSIYSSKISYLHGACMNVKGKYILQSHFIHLKNEDWIWQENLKLKRRFLDNYFWHLGRRSEPTFEEIYEEEYSKIILDIMRGENIKMAITKRIYILEKLIELIEKEENNPNITNVSYQEIKKLVLLLRKVKKEDIWNDIKAYKTDKSFWRRFYWWYNEGNNSLTPSR